MRVHLNSFLLFTIASIFALTSTKPCGIVPIITNAQRSTNTDFLISPQELGTGDLGTALTITGWFRLNEVTRKDHPLFALRMLPNEGESNFPSTFSELIKVSFNNLNPNEPVLYFRVADTLTTFKEEFQTFALPPNEWVAATMSFDYAKNLVVFNFKSNNFNLSKTITTNMSSFSFRRKLEFIFGCFPTTTMDALGRATILESCSNAEYKNVSYLLEFFQNANRVHLINQNEPYYLNIGFDAYQGQTLKVTSTQTPNIGFALSGSSFFDSNGLFAFNGRQTVDYNLPLITNNQESSGFSDEFRFIYKEPLPDKFAIFNQNAVISGQNIPLGTAFLVKKDNNLRSVRIELADGQNFETGATFTENRPGLLRFQLFHDQNQNGAILQTDNEMISSQNTPLDVRQARRITLSSLGNFTGQFRFLNINHTYNNAGFYYQQIRDPNSVSALNCKSNCTYLTNLSEANFSCGACNTLSVYDFTQRSCIQGCGAGFFNQNGICYSCVTPDCATQVRQTFFNVTKPSRNTLEITQLNNLDNFTGLRPENFNVTVPGATEGVDYTRSITPSANKLTYVYNFNPNFDTNNKNFNVALNNQNQFLDPNRNFLRNQNWTFSVDPTQAILPVTTTTTSSTPILIPIIQPTTTTTTTTQPVVTVIQPEQTVAVPVLQPQPTVVVPLAQPQPTVVVPLIQPQQTVAVPIIQPQQMVAVPLLQPQQMVAVPLLRPQQTVAVPLLRPIVATAPIIAPLVVANDRNQMRNTSVENSFKGWAHWCFAIFLLGMLFGIIGLCFRCPYLTDFTFYDFYYQKFIQTFLMAQYMAFWALYNTFGPYNLMNFLHWFLKLMATWHKQIWTPYAWRNHDDSADFRNNWIANEKRRFFEERIVNHFVIQFGFILLCQLVVLFIWGVIKLMFWLQTRNTQPERFNALTPEEKARVSRSRGCWNYVHNCFDMKILWTVFLIFTVEATVFFLYNFHHYSYKISSHSLYRFSLALAIIYCIVYILMWLWTLAVPLKTDAFLDSEAYRNKWGFVYTGLQRRIPHKLFQGLQYLFYALFAFILTVAYSGRVAQILINLIAMFLWMVFIIVVRPANTRFWQLEQIGIHILLFLAKLWMSFIVFDDQSQKWRSITRWRWGYAIAFFIMLVLLWNTIVLIWRLLDHVLRCWRAKRGLPSGQIGYQNTTNVYGGNVYGNNLAIGTMQVDEDYETIGTRYRTNVQGDYELVNRPDLEVKRVAYAKEQDVPSFFNSNLSDKKHNVMGQFDTHTVSQQGNVGQNVVEERIVRGQNLTGQNIVEEKVIKRQVVDDVILEEKIPLNPDNYGNNKSYELLDNGKKVIQTRTVQPVKEGEYVYEQFQTKEVKRF